MQPQAASGIKAGGAANFAALFVTAGFNCDAGSDRTPVAGVTIQLEDDPVAPVGLIEKQQRQIVHADNDQIQTSVAIEILLAAPREVVFFRMAGPPWAEMSSNVPFPRLR